MVHVPPAVTTALPPLHPEPPRGRVFEGTRTVRSTDVTPGGRLRLDALARALQDVAEDDVADTGWRAPYGWLLRRCAVTVHRYPEFGARLRLRTFCSATGPRWAQRTTTVAGPQGPLIQSVALWAAVDLATGQPVPLGDEFFRHYGEATQGRKASARLSLPRPEPDAAAQAARPARGARGARDWPLRAADFDTAGHVNNAIAWAAVEDLLATQDWLPSVAELEYHRPILPGCQPRLLAGPDRPAAADGPDGPDGPDGRNRYLWLLEGSERLATAGLYSAGMVPR